jgi:hypothetical protein
VLDHLANVALRQADDNAWLAWMRVLEDEPKGSALRSRAFELDLKLRVTRNVLSVHSHPLHLSSIGVSAPGAATMEAFDPATLEAHEAVEDLGQILRRHHWAAIPWFLEQLEFLAEHAGELDQRERDSFRRWSKLGLRSTAPNDVTWRVVELTRAVAALSSAPR